MSSRQIQTYISQFKDKLQAKIAKSVSIRCLIFYSLYSVLQIWQISQVLENRTLSEQSYLKEIGDQVFDREKMEVHRILDFLDQSRKLVQSGLYDINDNASGCNNAYFLCSLSTLSNYSTVNSLFSLLSVSSNPLSLNRHQTYHFLFNDLSQIVYFNMTALNLLEQDVNTSAVNNFLVNTPLNSSGSQYIMNQVATSNTSVYQFYCLRLSEVIGALCVVRQQNVQETALMTKNNQIFRYKGLKRIQNGLQTMTLDDWVASFESEESEHTTMTQCLQNSPQRLSKYIPSQSGIASFCTNQYQKIFGMEGGCFPYIYYTLTFQTAYMPLRYSSVYSSPTVTLTFYIASNSTYHDDNPRLISQHLTRIRVIGYSIVASIAICLLLVKTTVKRVQVTLIQSIVVIRSLCQYLKNKEEKQFYAVKEKPQWFSFITQYFQKFMWISKLLKFKSKMRHKKLLQEGIQLFSKDYASVQQYILRELISIESNLVEKYLKLRQLPTRKKTTIRTNFSRKEHLEMVASRQEEKIKTSKHRRNANYSLVDADNDELMKNISVSLRSNRGVRFSNDIQTIQIDQGPILRKAKFSDVVAQSCQTIKNDLSEPQLTSMKHTEMNKDSIKSLKQQDSSYTSINDMKSSKKKESLRSRGLQSVHFDLNNMRLDQSFDAENEDDIERDASQEEEMYYMGYPYILNQTCRTYRRIITFYEDLIALKSKDIPKIVNQEALSHSVCNLYQLTLRKYGWLYELLSFQNNNKDLQILTTEEEREEISQFQDLVDLEHNYQHSIRHELMQKGELVKLQIHEALQLPVPFKNLEYLAKSGQRDVKVNARYLLAVMAELLTPHLDEILFHNICHILQHEQTNCILKRKFLSLLIRTLQRYFLNFPEEIAQLKLVRQFYNTKNKKFYFLASMNNPKPFIKLLNKFHDLIHPFDIVCIFNLDEDSHQTSEHEVSDAHLLKTKIKKSIIDKTKFLLDFQDFTESFNFSLLEKLRQSHNNQKPGSSSAKTLNKKKVYQKEFHQILHTIENDQTEFSKYIVVLLGDEQGAFSSEAEQSSSSGNRRPYQQKIHQQITKNIDRGYHHYVMAGYQLSAYPSKYGRLKKYLKLAPELLQIDLSDKYQEQNYRLLQKYLK